MLRLHLAAIALAVLVGQPALAFVSQPFGAIHRAITESALADAGLSARAIARVVDGDTRQDWEEMTVSLAPDRALFVPNGRYDPAHHFDRNAGEADMPAFRRGVRYLQRARLESSALLRAGRDGEGLALLGRLVHGAQDFCSHSNVIDLDAVQQERIWRLMAGRGDLPPVGLHLTGYDRLTGRDPVGDPYGHNMYSKDSPTYTPEARRVVGGVSEHERAVAAAVEATREQVRLVRHLAGEAAWRRLADY